MRVRASDWAERPYRGDRRIKQLAPAEPGWRAVMVLDYPAAQYDREVPRTDEGHPVPDLWPLDRIASQEPIIAWALVEWIEDGLIYCDVVPVTRGDEWACTETREADLILASGEEPDEEQVGALIGLLVHRVDRARQAAERRAAERQATPAAAQIHAGSLTLEVPPRPKQQEPPLDD